MSHGISKRTILFSSALLLLLGLTMLAAPARTSADAGSDYCQGENGTEAACAKGYAAGSQSPPQNVNDACGSYKEANKDACQSAWGAASNQDPAADCSASNCDFVDQYINPAIDLFSLSFGLIAVVSIIFGAIQYTASQGDPQKASAAKSRISNTIFAVIAYLFLYAFLQFIIPGGAFQ